MLPPSTPYFKVKYNYKGTISEDVYIQFTPDTYQYYYDCVRIHCEGDNLLIPIHAYPVINNKKDLLLPKFVDMGHSSKKSLTIDCISPVSFEYQIDWIVKHPDIHITPMSGDIKPNSKTKIEI